MSIAFVLSGGASLGAVQVGMWRALAEHGIHPDLIVGTSVGALNGAFVAGHPGLPGIEALAEVWRGLRRRDVFPLGPLDGLLGYYGVRESLVSPSTLRRLVAHHLVVGQLEAAKTPVHVVATDALTGEDVVLSRGDAVEAVLASTAIPAVFPPVVIGGRALIDGGIANNTPISHAVAMGATVIYVLAAGHPCAIAEPPRTALGMALQALSLLIGRRLADDVEKYARECVLHVVPPLCPLNVRPHDFDHASELIARAYESTNGWLAADMATMGGQARLVRPHVHAAVG